MSISVVNFGFEDCQGNDIFVRMSLILSLPWLVVARGGAALRVDPREEARRAVQRGAPGPHRGRARAALQPVGRHLTLSLDH